MTARNVIFFHPESWDGRMLGYMGHPALAEATPNIDRIAADGARFPVAYCTNPICCPSRANMWSGQYTHRCESWNNHKGLDPHMWALIDALPNTHTVHVEGKLDYRSGGHSMMNFINDLTVAAGIAKPVMDEDPSQAVEVREDRNPRCHESQWQQVDRAIEFLRRQAESPSDRPFFLYFGLALVHPKFVTNRYWLDRIPEDRVDIPPIDGCDHPGVAYQRNAKGWRHGLDDDTVRLVRRIYMAMCAECDALAGRVYDAMHELGLADSTHLVFGSDHGELALEHQQYYKMSMYEGSARVPLIITGPDVPAGRRCENIVSNIDLCPTLCEMAGVDKPPVLDGESLMPLATGATDDSRNEAHAAYMGITVNTSSWMLRRGRYKYIAYVGQPSQLFDLDADPGELNDLAGREPDVAAGMDRRLREIVDYEQAHRHWQAYCKRRFAEFRREARRGLYVDNSYGLAKAPSRDYWTMMDNAYTGYDQADEARIDAWLEAPV